MIDELLVEIQRIKRDLEALLSREASGVNASGWVSFGVTLTYASATTITLPGDYSSILSVGDKLRYTQTTVKYAYITAVSYSSPSTTITINAGTDYTLTSATITATMYSKAASPVGFPQWFNWSPTLTGFSSNPTGTYRFSVVGRTCFVTVFQNTNGVSNSANLTISSPITGISNGGFAHCYYAMNSGSGTDNASVFMNGATINAALNGTYSWATTGNKRVVFSLAYEF